jgi:hypothetical protein
MGLDQFLTIFTVGALGYAAFALLKKYSRERRIIDIIQNEKVYLEDSESTDLSKEMTELNKRMSESLAATQRILDELNSRYENDAIIANINNSFRKAVLTTSILESMKTDDKAAKKILEKEVVKANERIASLAVPREILLKDISAYISTLKKRASEKLEAVL